MNRFFIKRIAATVALLFILSLAVSPTQRAHAQNTNTQETPQTEPGQENANASLREQINLTPEQMTKIRAILEQNKDERQATRRRVNQAQRALNQAIYSGSANEAEISQRTHELSEAQAAEVRLRAATELSISRVLTPEQINKFNMIREKAIRDAAIKRRQENATQQKPLNNRRLENAIRQQTPAERRKERRVERRNNLPPKTHR